MNEQENSKTIAKKFDVPPLIGEANKITDDGIDAILCFMAAFLEYEVQYENLYRELDDNE